MLDDSVAHCRGKKIDNGGVNFSRRSKRPALLAVGRNDLCNLIGELFLNAAIGFRHKLSPFRNGSRPMVGPRTVADRKTAGEIAHLIDHSPVRVGDVERLY